MDSQHRWPPESAAELFVECADTLVAGFDLVEFLIRLCERCAGVLDVDAAGLVLADPQDRLQVMAASSESVRQLELLQIESGQGPCLDCHRAGAPVVISDLAEDGGRWPRFTPAAREAGFAAVHALPMRYHDQVIGAMNLFAGTPGGLHPDSVRIAQALTDVATIGLLQHRERTGQAAMIDQLHTAVSSRVVIEQAKGMLAERFGLAPDQAFRLLRRHARDHNRRLTELAGAVVSGRDDLPRPGHGTR
ncbi:ANTAR domain-containing response regulator [Pseudonocardia parietis]|uniref:GAF domain-containing protein n=1 Tax=Pseudonocardia parietis TaxID=570936 RepID=A0ABS4VWY0_9PSEU|nr:GAF and ANTAR domain-containing protein [Pseudonocardia parietis]MBP2368444.1 GAF domain-containing protein [Pseudonocardia parietis]